MKRICLLLVILIYPFFSYSNNWIPIGPDTVAVNNVLTSYSADILLLSDGILVNDGNGWEKYSKENLPVWDAIELAQDTLILVMGNGSFSDGIYKFVVGDSLFQILRGGVNPHFIVKNPYNHYYYVGSEEGLVKSADGIVWEEVDFFKNKNCLAMDFYNEHCVISVSGDTSGIYFSADGGNSWTLSSQFKYHFSDFVFTENGLLYGVFSDKTWSSGLWASKDYGENWNVEFWATNISSIGYTADRLFVSWHEPDVDKEGIAIWDTLSRKLIFLNDGLPNVRIRNIKENQIFDCANITVCTDSGAYCLTEFPVGIKNKIKIPKNFYLTAYPNPFNSAEIFSFELSNRAFVQLTIYDINGKIVEKLASGVMNPGMHKIEWNANDQASGLYIYQFRSGHIVKTGKIALVK